MIPKMLSNKCNNLFLVWYTVQDPLFGAKSIYHEVYAVFTFNGSSISL